MTTMTFLRHALDSSNQLRTLDEVNRLLALAFFLPDSTTCVEYPNMNPAY